MARENDLEAALREFVEAINSTGGATVDNEGYTVPVADQEWIDLGMAYEKACKVLGVEPKIDDAAFNGLLRDAAEDVAESEDGLPESHDPEVKGQ